MMSFLDAIACVISRTTHALDVITSISRYDRRSNLFTKFFYHNNFCGFKNKTSARKVRPTHYADREKLGLPKSDMSFPTLCVAAVSLCLSTSVSVVDTGWYDSRPFWPLWRRIPLPISSKIPPSFFSNFRTVTLYKYKLLDKNVKCIMEVIHVWSGGVQNYTKQDRTILDFKLSPCSECCMISSG